MRSFPQILFVTIITTAVAFAPSRSNTHITSHHQRYTQQQQQQPSSSSALSVGSTMNWRDVNQDESSYLLQQASDCASSDSCTLEDARLYLTQVMDMQETCSVNTNAAICDDPVTLTEVGRSLRGKIQTQTLTNTMRSVTLAAVPSVGLFLLLATGVTTMNGDMTPFTPQEWWWAVRDGYVPLLMQEYFQSGGFVHDASSSSDITATAATPFTLQEWFWSIKGGYVNTQLDHWFRNGGLVAAVENNNLLDAAATTVMPITLQEWLWSIQGGYGDQLLMENYQNGGLSTTTSSLMASNDIPVLTMAPQEWWWAVRDGYFTDMVSHYSRNAGL